MSFINLIKKYKRLLVCYIMINIVLSIPFTYSNLLLIQYNNGIINNEIIINYNFSCIIHSAICFLYSIAVQQKINKKRVRQIQDMLFVLLIFFVIMEYVMPITIR